MAKAYGLINFDNTLRIGWGLFVQIQKCFVSGYYGPRSKLGNYPVMITADVLSESADYYLQDHKFLTIRAMTASAQTREKQIIFYYDPRDKCFRRRFTSSRPLNQIVVLARGGEIIVLPRPFGPNTINDPNWHKMKVSWYQAARYIEILRTKIRFWYKSDNRYLNKIAAYYAMPQNNLVSCSTMTCDFNVLRKILLEIERRLLD